MESRRYVDEDGNERSALQDEMDKLAAKYGDEYPPVRDYRKLKDGAPDTVNSVILMLNGMFSEMFAGWFQNTGSNYNAFIKSMLHGNIKGKYQTLRICI